MTPQRYFLSFPAQERLLSERLFLDSVIPDCHSRKRIMALSRRCG
jgi:hypothetical protein